MSKVSREQVRRLIGKSVYAVRKDGSVVKGKLEKFHDDTLHLVPLGADKGKVVHTRALLPLVLFDLLAIGTIPFFSGGFGGFGGYGGYGGFGGNGYGGGYGYGPNGYKKGCGSNGNYGYNNYGYKNYGNGYGGGYY